MMQSIWRIYKVCFWKNMSNKKICIFLNIKLEFKSYSVITYFPKIILKLRNNFNFFQEITFNKHIKRKVNF